MRWRLVLMGLVFFAAAGCNDDDNSAQTAARVANPPSIHERAFAQDPGLVADSDQVVVINLEPRNSPADPAQDTGDVGSDLIPIWYPGGAGHRFNLELLPGDLFSLVLYDKMGNPLLFLDKDMPSAPVDLAKGVYSLEVHHGSGSNDHHALFIRPGSTNVGRGCENCDLAYQDLAGANLAGADFYGTFFNGSDLTGADLSGAWLANADFSNATMTNAKFNSATIDGAYLHRVQAEWAEFNMASLSGSEMSFARFHGAEFNFAVFKDAIMTYADLSATILVGADLSGASLSHADLSGARLDQANLSYARLSGADLTGASFTGANLSRAIWPDGRICAHDSIGTCN